MDPAWAEKSLFPKTSSLEAKTKYGALKTSAAMAEDLKNSLRGQIRFEDYIIDKSILNQLIFMSNYLKKYGASSAFHV